MSCITYEVKVYPNGGKHWHLNGKLHREDGPAIEFASGDKAWFLNGVRHREDGPAIEYAYGYKAWYINGKYLTKAEFNLKVNTDSYEGKVVEIEGKSYKLIEF